ncbi:hypothetical protein HJFPF1_07821 [Paramyrothecium foliicola]|nr:hypothetical protein HJFPF1_07821 [Paramyrothecium foliicola]
MFDVIWTDPNRELVGEHRAKKDRKKEKKQADRSERNSLSTRSSLSSADSPFSFFRPKAMRHARTSKENQSMESVAAVDSIASSNRSMKSPVSQAFDFRKARRASVLSTTGAPSFNESSRPSQDQSVRSRLASTGGELSPSVTSYESIFSQSPDSDGRASNSILERASEDLGQIASWNRLQGLETIASRPGGLISSYRKRHSGLESLAPPGRTCQDPLTPPQTPMTPLEPANSLQKEPIEVPVPPPKNPLRRSSQRASTRDVQNEMPGDRGPQMRIRGEELGRIDLNNFAMLQDKVLKMASTTPQHILDRLKTISVTNNLPPRDANVDIERRQWTLDTYHLSEDPLHHASLPSIHALPVPYVSAAIFPALPEQFDEVYALSLPSVCPSSEIAGILKNINRTLRSGGIFKLTLIDPLPRTATLGRHLRSWLEKHLLANLRKRFRCTNPRQVFPQWLGEAALRGPGSTLTTTKFYALPENVRQGHEPNKDPILEELWAERETKAELRSLVGRSLWMLVWGAYVTADKWWWEDAACVAECLELGTVWEYHQICAVKHGSNSEASKEGTSGATI